MSDLDPRPEHDNDDAFDDAALRRALAQAPDHGAVPDFRIGRHIRRLAHEALAPYEASRDLLPMLPTAPPWWRRLLFSPGGHARMPWNAAFATVLVAGLVTVLWQREPVPGPQLDSQSPAPKARAPAAAPGAPAAPETGTAAGGEATPAVPPGTPAAPAAPATSAAAGAPTPPAAPPAAAEASAAAPKIALPPTVDEAPAFSGPPTPPVEPKLPFQLTLPPPAPAAPLPPESAAQATAPSPDAARKREQRSETQGRAANEAGAEAEARAPAPARRAAPSQDAAAPAGAMAPPPPMSQAAPVPPAGPAARAAAVAAAPSGVAADSSVSNDLPPQPTFAALGQWTRMTVTAPGGPSRSFTRDEARDLGALLGSAALTAVGPQPLRNKVEWRVTLERDGKPLAQFELARGEVRWRENRIPATTGQPPEGALDGLRAALREATVPRPEPSAPAAAPVPEVAPPEPPP